MHINSNVYLVNLNANAKFGLISSIPFKDIELKWSESRTDGTTDKVKTVYPQTHPPAWYFFSGEYN